MEQQRGILRGGPFAGKVIHIRAGCEVFVVPYLAESLPIEIELPKRRWWHRLLRRPIPLPPDVPTFRDLRYRATGEVLHGNAVYQYEDSAA
jgi:hypothetical protein